MFFPCVCRVLVLDAGRVVDFDTPSNVFQRNAMFTPRAESDALRAHSSKKRSKWFTWTPTLCCSSFMLKLDGWRALLCRGWIGLDQWPSQWILSLSGRGLECSDFRAKHIQVIGSFHVIIAHKHWYSTTMKPFSWYCHTGVFRLFRLL